MKKLVLACEVFEGIENQSLQVDMRIIEKGEEADIKFIYEDCIGEDEDSAPIQKESYRFISIFKFRNNYVGRLSDGRNAVLVIGRKLRYLYVEEAT